MKRLSRIGLAALFLTLALLGCNLSQAPEPKPEDDVPTLGTLYNTRVPTLIPATATPTHTLTFTPVPPTDTPEPTATPPPSNTPPPPAQAPAAPAQPAAPPPTAAPTSPPADPSAGQPFNAWFTIVGVPTINDADNTATHQIYLNGYGGSGVYRYFFDGRELSGPQFPLVTVLCSGFVAQSARVEDTAGNSKTVQIGFTAFCPTPYGCVDCELWKP